MITRKNSKNENCLLGTIDFKDLFIEQEIEDLDKRFKTKSIGVCKVEIYGSEGPVPHMHIFNDNKSFECCVCIYSNNYFAHGGKYKSKFTSKQSKEFNKWMQKINSKYGNEMTNWQVAVYLWENSNPDCKFPESKKVDVQPHYENMTNYTK